MTDTKEKSPLVDVGPTELHRCLLPFEWVPSACWFLAQPQVPFRPRGLCLWGAPPGAELQTAVIATSLQLIAAHGGIPARFFSHFESYEQIAEALDKGKEPPAWCDWDTVLPGQYVRLTFKDRGGSPLGPTDGLELVMWGHRTSW